MLQNTQIPSVITLFLKKVFTYESGALALFGTAAGSSITQLFQVVFQGVESRDIWLPIVFSAGTFVLYLFTWMGDFATGMAASKKNGEKVLSSKLWRSFWKFFGVATILFIMLSFCLMLVLFDGKFFYNVFLCAIPSIMLMVILFEFHSIGENLEKLFGYKPGYFTFFDKLMAAIEKGIITKIGNWFSK